jgi:hypothetical protein
MPKFLCVFVFLPIFLLLFLVKKFIDAIKKSAKIADKVYPAPAFLVLFNGN